MTNDALPLTTTVALAPPVACPSCHTTHQGPTEEVAAPGAGWFCERCGQQWTASRLATVAEYEAWDRERGNAAPRPDVVIAR
jgi:hypothetical protein